MTEWQPIETAPKDGTEILCFAKDPRTPFRADYYGVAQWSDNDTMPGTVKGWFWPFAIRPTHWMPLPKPPVLGAAE